MQYDGFSSLTGNQYTIATNWAPSGVLTVANEDLSQDGIPDLRVSSTTALTPYVVTNLPAATALGTVGTGTATVTAKPTQTITWGP